MTWQPDGPQRHVVKVSDNCNVLLSPSSPPFKFISSLKSFSFSLSLFKISSSLKISLGFIVNMKDFKTRASGTSPPPSSALTAEPSSSLVLSYFLFFFLNNFFFFFLFSFECIGFWFWFWFVVCKKIRAVYICLLMNWTLGYHGI